MPKFHYHGEMPAERGVMQKTSRPNSLLNQCCEAAAKRFGWDDWSHYHRNNYHHAKEIKDKIYHMSYEEKVELLKNCQS